MLFNSVDFAIFLPIVFALYWLLKDHLKGQNLLLLVSSYFFYGYWDWRFLSLIAFSTLVDYTVGVLLGRESGKTSRKLLLAVSIAINLGFLGYFKYYNFFLENFVKAFSFFGYSLSGNSLNIILPVGISFYTFQTLSYSIDVYRGNLNPTRNFIAFASFVSFFPQLVAGPIERATHLLSQFEKKREFNEVKAVDGLRQILWGLFKKIVIADNCAVFANQIFSNYNEYSGSTLLLGALFFTFQIYGDFSGYSDIAIGTSRLFGFDLMRNFAFPYFSRNIAEFWRRWHISLSTWFRDYLYIPLGGSKGSLFNKIKNTFIIFIVSGFWHGANWTFIVWGLLNAFYFLPLLLTKQNRNHLGIVAEDRLLPNVKEIFQMAMTFSLTVLAWIFFRSSSLNSSFEYIAKIFSSSLFALPEILPKVVIMLIAVFVIIEWIGRHGAFALEKLGHSFSRPLRWGFYFVLIAILFLFSGEEQEFIYFQF